MRRLVRLEAPTGPELEQVRMWRNQSEIRAGLRTPYLLTEEQQAQFGREVVNQRDASHRYWSLHSTGPIEVDATLLPSVSGSFIGLAGLTHLQWENGSAEISLIINPTKVGEGWGASSVERVLVEAFGQMRLVTVYGECYFNNATAVAFWQKQVERWRGEGVKLPRRKWWSGQLWSSYYFSIGVEEWRVAFSAASPPA